MSDLSLTILAETPNDAHAIERLHERTFGPGRFVLSAYRLREHVDHLLDLSFTAWIGTLLVGSVRQLPICIGDTPALLLDAAIAPPSAAAASAARCSSLAERRESQRTPPRHLVGGAITAGSVSRPLKGQRCAGSRSVAAACWWPNWSRAHSQASPEISAGLEQAR
jgi:hypothetical protein